MLKVIGTKSHHRRESYERSKMDTMQMLSTNNGFIHFTAIITLIFMKAIPGIIALIALFQLMSRSNDEKPEMLRRCLASLMILLGCITLMTKSAWGMIALAILAATIVVMIRLEPEPTKDGIVDNHKDDRISQSIENG